MKLKNALIAMGLITLSSSAFAYTSNDEQIDDILKVLNSGSQPRKEQVLERLQWSGLTDPRLYDVFAQDLMAQYQNQSFDKYMLRTLAFEIRALGYSGNPKYQSTLEKLAKETKNSKLKRYASKAKKDLPQFIAVQQQLAKVSYEQADLPSEVVNYIRLMKTEDSYSQRLAAKAAYHEYKREQALVDLMAEKLRQIYMKSDLGDLDQDMAAWLCKALGRLGGYDDLLQEVADKSPYRKIQKYAKYRN